MEDILLLLGKFTQCDDTNDGVPGQTSPIVETPTSEIFAEIAAYFDAAPGAPVNATEAFKDSESDSESQSRTYRRRRARPDAATPSEESGGEGAPSVYPPVRSSARCKRIKGRTKYAFQAFRSPFLEGHSFSATPPPFDTRSLFSNIQGEAKLKTYAVGGFLKCLQLWQRVDDRRCFPASSLPAQYMDEDESLSPLSEGDETSDEDGIKVVGNDFFVKSTKRKKKSPCSQAGVRRPAPAQTRRRRSSEAKGGSPDVSRRGAAELAPGEADRHENDDNTDNDDERCRKRKKRKKEKQREVRVEEEEEASARPEDHSVTECTGDSPVLEEPGGPVVQLDSGSDVIRRVAPDVADGHDNDDERRRKRKKRKKEKRREVRVEEEASVSLDEPTSGSTMTLSSSNKHSSDGLVDQVDDRWAPKKKSKKKKKKSSRTDVAEEDVNDVDAVTGAPNETTPGGFKATPLAEDPETHLEAGNTEGGSPFKRPADREVAGKGDALETADSRRTSRSTVTFIHDDNNNNNGGGGDDERHQRKKRNKEKKRKVEEVTTSLDRRRPAVETGNVSSRTSTVTINDNDSDKDRSLEGPVDQSEDQCTPRKKKKKKKRRTSVVVTEEEVNLADTVTAHETTETTPGGFKKPKKKRQKIAAYPEDPETSPVGENAGGEGSPFTQPADREVERPRKKKRKKQEVAETSRRAGLEDTLAEGGSLTPVRKKKKKNKEVPPFLTE